MKLQWPMAGKMEEPPHIGKTKQPGGKAAIVLVVSPMQSRNERTE